MKMPEKRFFSAFQWHPVAFCCILTVSVVLFAGGGGCERRPTAESAAIDPETAEKIELPEEGMQTAEPDTWRSAAPVRERLVLVERNRARRKRGAAERTETVIRNAAENAVRSVLLFPAEAVFAAPGMPGTELTFEDSGHAVVCGWLIAPDETGMERRMQYRVRVRFERGIFVRAELPELTVEAAGKELP